MLLSGNRRLRYFIVFALGIVLYANTLYYQFVLDDEVVITGNTYVQKGIEGIPAIVAHDTFAGYYKVGQGDSIMEGGRYRPLSLVFFAAIYSLFGSEPFPFHLFSIFLYAFSGLVIMKWLLLLLRTIEKGNWIAIITTLFFIAHPLHTEVVANVKSADEILALIFGVGAMYGALRSVDERSGTWMILSFISMVIACLAKENAITLLLVAPISIWFFRDIKISALIFRTLPLIAGGFLFLTIRFSVLGAQPAGLMMHDPLNNPFLEWTGNAWLACSPMGKAATILYTFGLSLKLMVIPYPLTHDYYPFHIQLQSFSNILVILSLLVLLFMIAYSVWSVSRKKYAGFGLIFFLVTFSVTSNIFFPIGAFLAERFLYIPSLGLLLAFVSWGSSLPDMKNQAYLNYLAGGIVIVFSILTVSRNTAWKDNITLLRTDIVHSPNSAKGQNDVGTILLDEALKTKDSIRQKSLFLEAYPHLLRALELHPTYFDAYLAAAACAYYLRHYDQSVSTYRRAMGLFPGEEKPRIGIHYALQAYGHDQWLKRDTMMSLRALDEAWKMKQDTAIASALSRYYLELGQHEKSEEWHARAAGRVK
jgi:hypothetical protein